AVHDRAAKDFADEFYRLMLQGEYFGRTVQRARKRVYNNHKHYSNTWGAYQCYGDPYYTLVENDRKSRSEEGYLTEDEVLIDLFNIQSRKIEKFESKDEMLKEAKAVLKTAIESDLATPQVYQKIAEIHAEYDDLSTAIEFYEKMLKNKSSEYTVKGLEQYCNLRIKQFVEDKNKEKPLSLKPTPDEEKIIEDFKYLLEIFPTAQRYSLLGGAYKRFAYVFEDNQDFLKKTIVNYRLAFEKEKNDVKKYTYPLSNALQAQFFYDPDKLTEIEKEIEEQKKVEKEKKKEKEGKAEIKVHNDFTKFNTAMEWVEDSEQQLLELEAENRNFWEDIALINILTTKILYSGEAKVVEETTQSIIELYNELFAPAGTLKHLRSEIEQFNILAKLLDRIKDSAYPNVKDSGLTKFKMDQLKEISEHLEKLNKPKNEA
ncbi:MAG: tetratricopeptide repeat-containing protein, partial [Bacteroidota bacterium]